MHKTEVKQDRLGQKFGKEYSTILADPYFEARLKSFDPNLKLMFDQHKKKWIVLEWALDNSGWNLILTCEDKEGNPKPVGDWILNKLYVQRHNAEERRRNPQQYFDDLMYKAEYEKNKIEESAHSEQRAKLIDDIISWRKVDNQLNNRPVSDVTAGYPKVTIKPKGKGVVHGNDTDI